MLDADRAKSIVDLTLRDELVSSAEKKKKRTKQKVSKPEVGAKLECVIELVKPDYLVLSAASYPQFVAFAAVGGYNTHPDAFKAFSVGEKAQATVLAVCLRLG